MAKKKLAQATAFQLAYEKVMGIAAVILIFFHMFISFARHYFAPENNMGASPTVMMLLKIDRWFALALVVGFVAYLAITKLRFPATWYRIKDAFKRCVCKESVMLIVLFVCYLLACAAQSKRYTNVFKVADLWLLDAFLCCLILFPMANLIGYRKMKKIIEFVLHAVALLTTGYIAWALWNVFHLHILTLPNGLQVGMTDKYTFYPGVNQNIASAIGTTMVLISLYMIVSQRWFIRIPYAVAFVLHLYATLLTDSRAGFVALLVAIPLTAFMIVWTKTAKSKTVKRIIFSCLAALAAAAVMLWLRKGVFTIFDSVTHLSEYTGKTKKVGSLVKDTGRFRLWIASIHSMFSSAQRFFFGTPISLIPEMLQETKIELFGAGSLLAHAHNMILQTGLVTGVPGMIAFVAFLVMMAIRCVKVGIGKAKADFPGAFILPISILAMVIVNMFEPFLLFYLSLMGCVFFLFCGWIAAIDRGNE